MICFKIKEPEDEWFCEAVLIPFNTYETPRLNKEATQQYTDQCLT